MASNDVLARLRYLNESAYLLEMTAPATSRYLMSQYNCIALENDSVPSESQRQKVCGGCGTIFIIGREATLQIQSQTSRREKGNKKKAALRKAVVYKCGSCSRTTRFAISPTATKFRALSSRAGYAASPTKSTSLQPKPDTATSSATSANSSSKKRAKARKKGGLEAILANRKSSETQTSGFDFTDFLKPV